MKLRTAALVAILTAPALVGGCAYGPGYGPPPPGWAGESWARHVRRCARHFPNYDPRIDLIRRPGGPVPCPL